MFSLEGKTVVVSGGGKGIGRAISVAEARCAGIENLTRAANCGSALPMGYLSYLRKVARKEGPTAREDGI